jgi:hypothetical protein
MNEFEMEVLSRLGKIEVMATTSAANTDALKDRLFDGPSSVIGNIQTDISEIKEERKTESKWDRIHKILHYSITPVLLALHEVARKMGMPV